MTAAAALPNPVFEGSEKRLEVDFLPAPTDGPSTSAPSSASSSSAPLGLRALRRDQLDELMTLARCTIVSQRSNSHLDAYVLSESSLFVYPTKWVLKTCGTTRLLHSVPRLLELAAEVGLVPRRCKFTRASFLFPEQQLFPHCSPENEVAFLQRHFGHLQPGGGQATVVGDLSDGLQWHVYTAESCQANSSPQQQPQLPAAAGSPCAATCNLEICMTDLGRTAARQFYRDGGFVSAAETTSGTGIASLMPRALVDDYVFEPCGYSMNSIDGGALMTVHVTPEAGQSYASLEMSGEPGEVVLDPCIALATALRIFRPARASLALSVDRAAPDGEDGGASRLLRTLPPGYACCAAQLHLLPGGGRLAYYTFVEEPAGGAAAPRAAAAPVLFTSLVDDRGSLLSSVLCGAAAAAAKMIHADSCLSMDSASDIVSLMGMGLAQLEVGGGGGAVAGGGKGRLYARGGTRGSSVGSASDCAGMMSCDSEGEAGGSSPGEAGSCNGEGEL